jgi:hypothetical protein
VFTFDKSVQLTIAFYAGINQCGDARIGGIIPIPFAALGSDSWTKDER